jgi:hypothetical protein
MLRPPKRRTRSPLSRETARMHAGNSQVRPARDTISLSAQVQHICHIPLKLD